MAKSKFNVGDRVYLPYHYGTITAIYNDGRLFPIEVTWDEMVYGEKYVTIYDADGYSMSGAQDGVPQLAVVDRAPAASVTFGAWLNRARDFALMQLEKCRCNSKEKEIEEMEKDIKFKVGDRVYSRNYGRGVVFRIADPTKSDYPVGVHWINESSSSVYAYEYYTLDGQFHTQYPDPEYDIIHDEDDSESGRDIFLANCKKDEGVEDNMEEELKIGDWVWLNPNEKGIITFIYPNKETCIVDSELDGEVEAVMAGLTKVEYSPINPSHYQVKGIPEAIDIMKHLMTQEQFKGFLWGNIIKYAYRYGRKGDEHDTAGKIEWYANRLKEVCAEEKKEQERE